MKDPVIYIGYDKREHAAYEVAAESIRRTASKPINIIPLKQEALRRAGLYSRSHYNVGEQKYDVFDRKPFSTDFSFTRFLVPALNQYEGLAIFMDCDMLIRYDVWELFDSYCKDDKAVWCVQHNYNPKEGRKMDDMVQQRYACKNWSSFVVWDCGHDINKDLTVDDVSTKDGRWLHGFDWIEDLAYIGNLPEEWNWLDGWSPEWMEPKNVHFTTGGPWFPQWEGSRDKDRFYALEWDALAQQLKTNEALKGI